jgi:hypothetical protein
MTGTTAWPSGAAMAMLMLSYPRDERNSSRCAGKPAASRPQSLRVRRLAAARILGTTPRLSSDSRRSTIDKRGIEIVHFRPVHDRSGAGVGVAGVPDAPGAEHNGDHERAMSDPHNGAMPKTGEIIHAVRLANS